MPPSTQTKSNHARLDPSFHFSLVPLIGIVVIWGAIHAFRHPSTASVLLAVLAILVFWTALKSRVYSLRVQDRLIRLEERLRLQALLPESLKVRIPELSERQLIALRFASDAEVPSLTARALQEGLTSKQIKESIQTWRPDYLRV